METLIIDKVPRIIRNKKRLEETLKLKITNRGKEVTIKGTPEDEYIGQSVLEALNVGFAYKRAITIKTENKILEKINIKEHTKRENLASIRARVIGKGGAALKTLSDLTDSAIELNENTISIITDSENLERITKALIEIIKGAKHKAVYKELENNFPKPIYDLGLKEEIKKFK